ncbi:TPA: hypothetical protein PIH69_002947 [Staphylococcus aureus]|nr:hypothetical protein [Staphylococcus aureus]
MVDQMTDLIVGSIYQGGAEGRRAPAPESPTRTVLLAKIAAARIVAWDSEQENALDALLAVLDWHRPTQIWKQVFKPTYIGDRYLGVGCRSCNWRAASDCPTVRAIATAFRVTPEPWIPGRQDDASALSSGLETVARQAVIEVLDAAVTSRALAIGDPSLRQEVTAEATDSVCQIFTDFLSEPR